MFNACRVSLMVLFVVAWIAFVSYGCLMAVKAAEANRDAEVVARFVRDFGKPSDCDCCTPCICLPCDCK